MAKVESPTPKKKMDISKVVMIIIIIALLGFNGYQAFLKTKADKKNEELTTEVNEKTKTIALQDNSLDSLETQLKERYDELAELGGDTARLGAQIRQLRVDKNRLRRQLSSARAANKQVKELQTIKAKYTEMLKAQDEELVKLRALSEALNEENTSLKTTLSANTDSLTKIRNEAKSLNKQVELGRILKAEKFKVIAINKKGKERFLPLYKTKHLEKLRIEFSLAPNKIALVETKSVFMQLVEPSGNTLYDLNLGSGEFENEGSKSYYTLKQDVIYDRGGVDVQMTYEQPTTYKSGKYVVNVFCEGEMVGSGSFLVK